MFPRAVTISSAVCVLAICSLAVGQEVKTDSACLQEHFVSDFIQQLHDPDPGVVKLAIDQCANRLYFDDRTETTEAELLSLFDYDNESVAAHAMGTCVDYGLRADRVIEKTFEYVHDPEFRKTDFYSNFVKYHSSLYLAWDEPDRPQIMALLRRELLSDEPAGRKLAVEILGNTTLLNHQEWRTFLGALEKAPEDVSEQLLQGLYSRSPHLVLSRNFLDENPQYQPIFAKAAALDPSGAVEFELHLHPDSRSAVERAKQLLRDGELRRLPLLEKLGHLPPGSYYFILEKLFQTDEVLFRAWKQQHPAAADLMTAVVIRQLKPEVTPTPDPDFSSAGSFFGKSSDFDFYENREYRQKLTIPHSELPLVNKMLNSKDLQTRLCAIDLLGFMGAPKYRYSRTEIGMPAETWKLSFERVTKAGPAYPDEVIHELEQLLSDAVAVIRVHALTKLIMAGLVKPRYLRILEETVQDAIEKKQFGSICRRRFG